jgi:hypothetical protein
MWIAGVPAQSGRSQVGSATVLLQEILTVQTIRFEVRTSEEISLDTTYLKRLPIQESPVPSSSRLDFVPRNFLDSICRGIANVLLFLEGIKSYTPSLEGGLGFRRDTLGTQV